MASTLPSAKELMAKAAEKEAQKAAEAMRLQAKADAEKKALIERLQQPSGLSDEEALRSVKMIIERAVNNGLTHSRSIDFPTVCLWIAHPRSINRKRTSPAPSSKACQGKCIWARQLKPLGYKLQFHIVDFPNGVPG